MDSARRTTIERHLAEEELDDLIADARDHHELRRLIFVKCLYRGDTLAEAAARVGRSDPTGSRWARRWNEAGPEGLMPDFGGGRPPKLDADERDRLLELLESGEYRTLDDVQKLLAEEFDVTYHPAYLRRLLRSLETSDSLP